MAGASQHIDRVLNWLKWPVATVTVLMLPNSTSALLGLMKQIGQHPKPILPLLSGLGVYTILWWLLFRRPIFGSFLSTLEHELTHALFALATFHEVTGLRATWRRGGHVRCSGPGNWLITIAPYFFPTICVAILVLSVFLPANLLTPIGTLMGVGIGYHLTSTYRETHAGQSDLRRVGWLFSVLFLPTANIITFGTLLSFCYGGTPLMRAFFEAILNK